MRKDTVSFLALWLYNGTRPNHAERGGVPTDPGGPRRKGKERTGMHGMSPRLTQALIGIALIGMFLIALGI